ncbi:MAG TPA: ferritin-like domain-containing protein [Haliangiales bacterium]|nr:ferritin-like domain-containing protein [Haliangiales bacterium]
MTKHANWPPYRLVEESLVDHATEKLDRLERLYHVGQEHAWDGRKVLAELIARHGKPRLPEDRKGPALKLLSVLLWGELAAWAISADLAERIDDIEAKMAATSQAHDEARHFYVLRDYLRALGDPIPRLGGLGRRLLVDILETDSLVHKLIGMQLLTESNALSIFRGLVELELEPVLSDLLPYYEKDESRHVGLGVLYLPRLLARMTRLEAAAASAFQIRCVALLISAGLAMREDIERLGMDGRRLATHTVQLQDRIVRDMVAAARGERKDRRIGGVVNPTKGIGPRVLDFLHPPDGKMTPLHSAAIRLCQAGAKAADRALA